MKKLIAAVVTTGLLVTGTAGVAYAADTPSTPPAEAPAHAQGHRRIGAALGVAADAIGIERSALVQELRDGKSLADVATEHDTQPQAVVDALVGAATKRIETAVTNGRIDADRAAKAKEHLPERVTKLVNADPKDLKGAVQRRVARAKLRRHARRGAFVVAAKTIGIPAKDLAEAVRGGKSVADVAKAHDVEPQAVVDAVVTAANEKIDAAVAEGRLDVDRAAKLKERFAKRVAERIQQTPKPHDTTS